MAKKKYKEEKIVITLTYTEAVHVEILARESSDTGNKEWDEIMKSIEKKVSKKVY